MTNMTDKQEETLRELLTLGRVKESSGGWISRNNLDSYLLGLMELHDLLGRTVPASEVERLT